MSLEHSPARNNRTADHSPFLTQPEAASFLRVSERSLERWRIEGTGPEFVRAGRRILYSMQSLRAWAADRTFRSTSEADAAKAAEPDAPEHAPIGHNQPPTEPTEKMSPEGRVKDDQRVRARPPNETGKAGATP